MALSPVDGPALQTNLTVTNAAIVEVKVGATPLTERKILLIQPLGGRIRVFFGYDDVVPSVSDVQNKGLVHFKNVLDGYEVSPFQRVYIISETVASQEVIIVERA